MTDICRDPLHYLVDRLCCRVYLDCGGNVRLGFSRRHGLEEMMTAQGIARSNAGILRDQLRQNRGQGGAGREDTSAVSVPPGDYCPLIS
jgi:hypothetical protein